MGNQGTSKSRDLRDISRVTTTRGVVGGMCHRSLQQDQRLRPKLARGVVDYINSPSNCPPPRLLEVGLICEQFGFSPTELGFDTKDPRVTRDIRMVLNVYRSAQGRHDAKDKSKWDKEHPSSVSLLRWARGGESKTNNPLEVRIQLPQRPKN